VVPSPDHKGRKSRYLIQFSEFARLNIPEIWKGDRNPVKYDTLEELGIDLSTLRWEPMPASPESTPEVIPLKGTDVGPLTMAEAKTGLALTFGVPPEAIEITIRG